MATERTCEACGGTFWQHRGRAARTCRECRGTSAVREVQSDEWSATRLEAAERRIDELEISLRAHGSHIKQHDGRDHEGTAR